MSNSTQHYSSYTSGPSSGDTPYASYVPYSLSAKPPSKPSIDSGYFDLFSAVDVIIEPGETVSVSTDVGLVLPRSVCGWITGADGLFTNGLLVETSIAAPDDIGSIALTFRNIGSHACEIKKGNLIGRMVLMRILNQRAIYDARPPQSNEHSSLKRTIPQLLTSTPAKKQAKNVEIIDLE